MFRINTTLDEKNFTFLTWLHTPMLHRRGDQRCLSAYKIKKKAKTNKGSDDLPSLIFSKEAQDVLQDIFMQYPPEDGEEGKEMAGEASAKVRKVFRWGDDIFSKPFMSKEVIAEKVESLAYKVENDAKLRQVLMN